VWYWGVLRGLESVVATVLLIVVAVVGVVLVYLWFSGYLGKYIGAAGQAVGPAGAAERFKVESASLAADGTVRLYIRNLGGAPVDVGTIYVYPAGSLNPICVGHGVNAAIPPGTLAEVQTTLTCTTQPHARQKLRNQSSNHQGRRIRLHSNSHPSPRRRRRWCWHW
jgi:hypothetical protein